MTALRAAWLGSWKAPWELGQGRRWGDPPWALSAIAQAWLLGGREGCWPNGTWKISGSQGPMIGPLPESSQARPDPAWISLLRHGSAAIPADRRGKREDELRAWCWQALLAGDAMPWLSAGTVLLDRPTRERWVALLGAADEAGTLHLPPFLEPLVPASLRTLPPGWWEFLLSAMDGEGRLLPQGTPPPELPWTELLSGREETFRPLALAELPRGLEAFRETRWVHPAPGIGFVVAPQLRAWARGFGACPAALGELTPPSLALGDPPTSPIAEILQGTMPAPGSVPSSWTEALQSDLAENPVAQPPQPCGDPSLDRLRMRWIIDPAPPAENYPAWGEPAHPCGDPFHWMAEGFLAYRRIEIESALRAFTLAHAHFLRLRSRIWADRAAANAAQSALLWGDIPNQSKWLELLDPQPQPFAELRQLFFLAIRDDWDKAIPLAQSIISSHPELELPWYYIASRGVELEQYNLVAEILPKISSPGIISFLRAFLDHFSTLPPADLEQDLSVAWWHHLAIKSSDHRSSFWSAWKVCPNYPLRLGAAISLLERVPEERSVARLLELQVMADRMDSPRHQERLQRLWPRPDAAEPEEPAALLRQALARRGLPAWLVWGNAEQPLTCGYGPPPPEGALSRLHRQGSLPPLEDHGFLWWGLPLSWEGTTVGHALAALDPDAPPDPCTDLQMLAPWVARLTPRLAVEPPPEGGALLADGSEPMASVLQELARVAPSELPLLILGPTGSGKELTAQEIHRRSGRPGALVPVNCSAFAESLLESEIFGHVRGAFTGADRDRRGAIETADKGTLFLDEVADLSPRLQSLFLRVLQEREVRRVGSDRAIHVDVRFLAATHRSLEDLAASGAFRRDLLFRLQGSVLRLPSLRERRHEFPFLVPRLLVQVAQDAKRECPDLAPGVAQALGRLPWPGNFRELRHALERALLRCEKGPLKRDHFPELQTPLAQERTWEQATRDFQRRLLLRTLHQHHFRATEAARSLGISRPALYAAAKRIGLDLVMERERWQSQDTTYPLSAASPEE